MIGHICPSLLSSIFDNSTVYKKIQAFEGKNSTKNGAFVFFVSFSHTPVSPFCYPENKISSDRRDRGFRGPCAPRQRASSSGLRQTKMRRRGNRQPSPVAPGLRKSGGCHVPFPQQREMPLFLHSGSIRLSGVKRDHPAWERRSVDDRLRRDFIDGEISRNEQHPHEADLRQLWLRNRGQSPQRFPW